MIPLERPLPAEPLVDNDAERILITGKRGFPLQLLRSRVRQRTGHFLRTEQFRRLSKQSDAKITEKDLLRRAKQYVLWLDISVNDVVVMGILESGGHLHGVSHRGRERETST